MIESRFGAIFWPLPVLAIIRTWCDIRLRSAMRIKTNIRQGNDKEAGYA
jgi:hypothetical protein